MQPRRCHGRQRPLPLHPHIQTVQRGHPLLNELLELVGIVGKDQLFRRRHGRKVHGRWVVEDERRGAWPTPCALRRLTRIQHLPLNAAAVFRDGPTRNITGRSFARRAQPRGQEPGAGAPSGQGHVTGVGGLFVGCRLPRRTGSVAGAAVRSKRWSNAPVRAANAAQTSLSRDGCAAGLIVVGLGRVSKVPGRG